jgi:hypothetical protein
VPASGQKSKQIDNKSEQIFFDFLLAPASIKADANFKNEFD